MKKTIETPMRFELPLHVGFFDVIKRDTGTGELNIECFAICDATGKHVAYVLDKNLANEMVNAMNIQEKNVDSKIELLKSSITDFVNAQLEKFNKETGFSVCDIDIKLLDVTPISDSSKKYKAVDVTISIDL